jgi:hypothetical protein
MLHLVKWAFGEQRQPLRALRSKYELVRLRAPAQFQGRRILVGPLDAIYADPFAHNVRNLNFLPGCLDLEAGTLAGSKDCQMEAVTIASRLGVASIDAEGQNKERMGSD